MTSESLLIRLDLAAGKLSGVLRNRVLLVEPKREPMGQLHAGKNTPFNWRIFILAPHDTEKNGGI